MTAIRVSERRIGETRSAVLASIRKQYPMAEPDDVRALSLDDARTVASLDFVTRDGGTMTLDWSVVGRALGRHVTPMEQRVIREAALAEPVDEVGQRIEALARAVDDAIG